MKVEAEGRTRHITSVNARSRLLFLRRPPALTTEVVMKLIPLTLILLAFIPQERCPQLFGHKSEAEVARMTPEQRVEESCRHYVRHKFALCDYGDLIEGYVERDGLRAVPYLIKTIDSYDPTRRAARGETRWLRCEHAWMMLDAIDVSVVRLRASDEGRRAIAALKQLAGRMQAAGFDTDAEEHTRWYYERTVDSIKEMEGLSGADEAIQKTLKLKYKISLSDEKMLDFVNYLIVDDSRYPSQCDREMYKDLADRNEAGNPRQYPIEKNIEVFYKAYLRYQESLGQRPRRVTVSHVP
jgi:hypothetical protein